MREFPCSVWMAGLLALARCGPAPDVDIIIRGGTIYDGSGGAPFVSDVAIKGDTVSAIGDLATLRGRIEVDARGLAVAPGFINMLSGASTSLIHDGRSQSEIRQGVTLEVFGEGRSKGPLSDTMKVTQLARQGDRPYAIEWTTLGEYLEYLVARGVAPNVASFVGATSVRVHTVGYEDRPATPAELDQMRALVRQAMEEGALGVGSALIYAPANYAPTAELIALCEVAAEYDGLYISHMRSEADDLMEALEELFTIARRTGIRAEIYHLKASRQRNWGKLDELIRKVEAAQAEGLRITADMYTYSASSTGLSAITPLWVQEGGFQAWAERMQDPVIREWVAREIREELTQISPEDILLVGFRNQDMRSLTGKTLADVAAMWGSLPEIAVMDLVIKDDSRVQCVYFTMSEENVRKKIALSWVAFCSDAASMAPEGGFLNSQPHPRAYGSFARLLGRYVRDEQIIPLEEAIRRLTSFPAENLMIKQRGRLVRGYFADLAIFDPQKIQDHATFEKPHQYATGMVHVFVNGVQVLKDGEHTGATPGRVVRGPGWR